MFTLSKQIQRLSPSMTVEISNLAAKLKSQGRDILSFSVGEPDFDTPQIVKDEAKKAIDEGFNKYTAVDGIVPLKNSISGYMKRNFGLDYSNDELSVASGAKHSLFNLFASLINDGDEVIIPTPYWVSYPEHVKYFGGKPVFCETSCEDNFKITPELLSKSITSKTRMLIMCSPSNPTGILYTKKELEEIAKVLESTNIIVISDEIYERLIYDGISFTSIASINEDMLNRTIVINGVSKSSAMTGWRLGFLACKNKDLIKTLVRLQSQSTTNVNSITQKASIKVFDGSADADIEKMRQTFESRRDLSLDLFSKIEGLNAVKPNGAFYLFVDANTIEKDSIVFCKRLLQDENVAVVPGVAFGQDGFFRFSFATNEENIRQGIQRIANFVANY